MDRQQRLPPALGIHGTLQTEAPSGSVRQGSTVVEAPPLNSKPRSSLTNLVSALAVALWKSWSRWMRPLYQLACSVRVAIPFDATSDLAYACPTLFHVIERGVRLTDREPDD
jgi:hypothetical protein